MMRAKVAVATLQGKGYFLIVSELRHRRIPFISLFPGDPVRSEIRVVITTKQEAPLISQSKVLVYDPETDPEILGSEVVKALQGKEVYETVVIGVDPGEVFGVAVIADGIVVDSDNCFSVKETVDRIKSVMRTVDVAKSTVTIKVGGGVPIYKDLLEALDEVLPPQVVLEIVSEAGTDSHVGESHNRRGFRHIISAIRIAGRAGFLCPRGGIVEQES